MKHGSISTTADALQPRCDAAIAPVHVAALNIKPAQTLVFGLFCDGHA